LAYSHAKLGISLKRANSMCESPSSSLKYKKVCSALLRVTFFLHYAIYPEPQSFYQHLHIISQSPSPSTQSREYSSRTGSQATSFGVSTPFSKAHTSQNTASPLCANSRNLGIYVLTVLSREYSNVSLSKAGQYICLENRNRESHARVTRAPW
jgi:hypothetical protein